MRRKSVLIISYSNCILYNFCGATQQAPNKRCCLRFRNRKISIRGIKIRRITTRWNIWCTCGSQPKLKVFMYWLRICKAIRCVLKIFRFIWNCIFAQSDLRRYANSNVPENSHPVSTNKVSNESSSLHLLIFGFFFEFMNFSQKRYSLRCHFFNSFFLPTGLNLISTKEVSNKSLWYPL